ncbi:MAG: hypothetical protein M3548_21380 [Actinomycetota bacterium]|nr:hypothetical protein [Actinomycetota bacterium]
MRLSGHRRTAAMSVAVGLLVGAIVMLAAGLREPVYEGRVGLIASPVTEAPGTAAAQYGEVVSLVLPALVELARSPSVLSAAVAKVPDAPTPEDLGQRVSVELVPASGLARLSVRAPSSESASALVFAVARAMIETNLLTPVSTLRLLDERADITRVAPDWLLVVGLALAAAVAAGVATAAVRNLPTSGRSAQEQAVRDALSSAGRLPAAILRGDDPHLVDRLTMLCAAAARRSRVIAVKPELTERADALSASLAAGVGVKVPAMSGKHGTRGTTDTPPDAAVIAVTHGGRGRQDELIATVGVLPESAVLVAVVLA